PRGAVGDAGRGSAARQRSITAAVPDVRFSWWQWRLRPGPDEGSRMSVKPSWQLRLGDRPFGPGVRPLLIAELSGNHNGQIERAFALMEAAAKAGADAIKIQTYTADTITLDFDG